MLYKIWQSVFKEFLLLKRDIGGLITLFVMPVVLVITVTLIQDSAYQVVSEHKMPLLLLDNDQGNVSADIKEQLNASDIFEVVTDIDGKKLTEELVRDQVYKGNYQLAIIIPQHLSRDLNLKVEQNVNSILSDFGVEEAGVVSEEEIPTKEIRLYFDPAAQIAFKNGVMTNIDKMVSQIENRLIYQSFEEQLGDTKSFKADASFISFKEMVPQTRQKEVVPNSVQHNVPAWTLFAIFFIIVPFAINIVKEKNQGTKVRLITNPTPYAVLMMGKTITYLIICLLQFYIILAVALYLFPYFGLPELHLHGKLLEMSVMTLFAGLAAIGCGILLGTIAKTQEQSAPFGSTFVVILAALGGVWIPVFAMPYYMQIVSKISPMNWALNGYYDILLRNGTLKDILPEMLLLFLFFIVLAFLALIYDKKKRFV
ncbi:ABC transporter permease [Myroides ceti]|uniref:ABC transporter permease n=1 Tax=Paenimyroides ceti TaxID=395087 RepID=A0ABT8CVX9_9FLAO|nr:ABC transporter permease [Paenimyroides ceti]MDN3708605.1 ABC transporter permease [Paenimyroides ceti]